MCRIDDAERVEIFQNADRKARKECKCSECWRVIAPGEVYRYEAGKCEGEFETYRTCSHCMVGRQWLLKNCHGYIYTQVLEEIREHAEEYPKIALGLYKISFGGSRKWQRKRGGLMPLPKMPRDISVQEAA